MEKTYEPKLMSAYPMLDNAITHLITARNVPNSEANVEFTYTCTYKSKGYNLKIQNTAVIDQHSHSILDISI